LCVARLTLALGVSVVVQQLHGLVLPAEWGEVQVLICRAEQVGDGKAGVGVQDTVAVAVEDADTTLLAGPG
jgi:hypothetical protein